MAVRAEVLHRVGLFAEPFFAYYEDADWSWRARRHGPQRGLPTRAPRSRTGARSTSVADPGGHESGSSASATGSCALVRNAPARVAIPPGVAAGGRRPRPRHPTGHADPPPLGPGHPRGRWPALDGGHRASSGTGGPGPTRPGTTGRCARRRPDVADRRPASARDVRHRRPTPGPARPHPSPRWTQRRSAGHVRTRLRGPARRPRPDHGGGTGRARGRSTPVRHHRTAGPAPPTVGPPSRPLGPRPVRTAVGARADPSASSSWSNGTARRWPGGPSCAAGSSPPAWSAAATTSRWPPAGPRARSTGPTSTRPGPPSSTASPSTGSTAPGPGTTAAFEAKTVEVLWSGTLVPLAEQDGVAVGLQGPDLPDLVPVADPGGPGVRRGRPLLLSLHADVGGTAGDLRPGPDRPPRHRPRRAGLLAPGLRRPLPPAHPATSGSPRRSGSCWCGGAPPAAGRSSASASTSTRPATARGSGPGSTSETVPTCSSWAGWRRARGPRSCVQFFEAYKERNPGPLALVLVGPAEDRRSHPDIVYTGFVDDGTRSRRPGRGVGPGPALVLRELLHGADRGVGPGSAGGGPGPHRRPGGPGAPQRRRCLVLGLRRVRGGRRPAGLLAGDWPTPWDGPAAATSSRSTGGTRSSTGTRSCCARRPAPGPADAAADLSPAYGDAGPGPGARWYVLPVPRVDGPRQRTRPAVTSTDVAGTHRSRGPTPGWPNPSPATGSSPPSWPWWSSPSTWPARAA